MSHLVLESNASPGVPMPSASMRNFVPPRGMFLKGGPSLVGRLPSDVHFEILDGETPGLADFVTGVGFALGFDHFRVVLESVNADVEFLTARVRYRGHQLSNYYLVNPLRAIKGLDLDASIVQLNSVGIAMSVEKLVLDESRFSGTPVSVVHETGHIVVQHEVAAALLAASCEGCSFVEPHAIHI